MKRVQLTCPTEHPDKKRRFRIMDPTGKELQISQAFEGHGCTIDQDEDSGWVNVVEVKPITGSHKCGSRLNYNPKWRGFRREIMGNMLPVKRGTFYEVLIFTGGKVYLPMNEHKDSEVRA